MSFEKRRVPLRRVPGQPTNSAAIPAASTPGVRPSPVTGQTTVSTGCISLDTLLAANAGLTLGQSLLIEETGTTDYASALLRCFAAEGVLQGHQVHVIGVSNAWVRDLPGTFEDPKATSHGSKQAAPVSSGEAERMKIAWRYERMGAHGERVSPIATSRQPSAPTETGDTGPGVNVQETFCHTFDFTKRLVVPHSAKPIHYIQLSQKQDTPPFEPAILALQDALSRSEPGTVHRVVIPSLISPAFYPPQSSVPHNVLSFLRTLRALLRLHSNKLSVMLSLPLSLYPRTTGLVRWIERLVDGVIELAPFPHTFDIGRAPGASGKEEEKPQGMVKVHALPVFTERGGGEGKGIAGGGGDDLCFVVSRRKFLIRAFDLPPVEGDTEAQKGEGSVEAKSMEF